MHAQVRRAYPEFVSELDMLTPEDVVWEPYSSEAVATRAPAGLSSPGVSGAHRVGACQSPGP